MHGFLFCSDHPDCTLLPQAQHIAAALPEYLLDGCMVPLQQLPGHISLNGACTAAALHPPCALTALQNALAQSQRYGQSLMPHIRCAVHILTQRKGSLSALLHQTCKHRELLCIKRIPLRQRAGILLK